ncbi:hypothetical protein GCM10027290_24130 [Micromonospora sonneratiae]|uniref:Uncharacterized protein n=1 Tax=Micromonospora sonneratiae TaxID=1184706 RepID=A0ABW3YFD5_9ACTN
MRRTHLLDPPTRLHPPLVFAAATMGVLTLVTLGGLMLDDRVLVGVPIWLKPFKFAVSLAIYLATLAWLLSLSDGRRRTGGTRAGASSRTVGWWLGTVIAAGALLEMVIIVGQAARGRQSHFNVATALDAALMAVMGATVVVIWCATAGIGLLLARQRIADRPAGWAIRLGLLVALVGLAIGYPMTTPTEEQRAGLGTSAQTLIGAHSVGVPDGGPGLPLLNWSTTGGDLRVGHFIGMHALQALPLVALGLAIAGRRVRRLADERVRVRLIAVLGAGYAGLTALVTWQALRGQPLIHPDAWTLAGAAVLLLGSAIGVGWALTGTPVAAGGAPVIVGSGDDTRRVEGVAG